jgi:putative SOS response-associated peptidase YedK
MCNLYSITSSQEAIGRAFRVMRDWTGNLPALPAVYPDSMAPVVHAAPGGARELSMMRWGFPPPPNLGRAPVTNVRNLKSPYWRGWLKAEWRCLVPANSFCEWSDQSPKVPHWFALAETRPLFAFPGIWRLWSGEHKGATGEHSLFAFLTTEPNAIVRPIHAKAMPVLLTEETEWNIWLSGPEHEALALQKPLSAESLCIAASGERATRHQLAGNECFRLNLRARPYQNGCRRLITMG